MQPSASGGALGAEAGAERPRPRSAHRHLGARGIAELEPIRAREARPQRRGAVEVHDRAAMNAGEAFRIEPLLELIEREVHVVPIVLGRGEHQLVLGAEPEYLVALENQLTLPDSNRQSLEVVRSGVAPASPPNSAILRDSSSGRARS